MTILITGGRGLIGTALAKHLRGLGHRVWIASRSPDGPDALRWNPEGNEIDLSPLDALDAVIHLAGENLAQDRWTARKKERILESRRLGTRTIVRAITARSPRPRVFISASGINYYPSNTGTVMTEADAAGEDFLSQVCQSWEAETFPARDAGIRVMRARLGVVLTPRGGALAQMLPIFKLGLGGRLGSGRQRMSWIALEDVIQVFTQALEDDRFSGPINVTSPRIITNAEFTVALAGALHRWTFLPVPSLALKLILGEMAEAALLADLAVEPAALQRMGYHFQKNDITEALATIGKKGAAP